MYRLQIDFRREFDHTHKLMLVLGDGETKTVMKPRTEWWNLKNKDVAIFIVKDIKDGK